MASPAAASRLKSAYERFVTRFPWVGTALSVLVYAIGVLWRWVHITRIHDPRKFVYSDMSLYVGLAKRFANPAYQARINDITHPPGATLVFAYLYRHDPTMQTMAYFNFAMCALAPLAIALLGWVVFGPRNAKITLAVISLYFPYVDYGGFFLAEMPFIVVIPLTLALLIIAVKRERLWAVGAVGLLAGVVFFCAIALKALALLAGFCCALVLVAFWRGAPAKKKAIALLAMSLGALPGTASLADRCTKANGGQFCLSNNKNASDILLGHYGRVQTMTWKDPKGGTFTFGSPSDVQKGYTEKPVMSFGMTDGKANMAEAKKWIKAHPFEATVLSLQHVWDLYSTQPWPSNSTKDWKVVALFQFGFVLFAFFPAAVRLVDLLRRDGLRAFLRSNEVLVLSPFIGLVAAVMLATGEPRYRIPFDSLFILVAIEFYRRWGDWKGTPAPAVSAAPEPPSEPAKAVAQTDEKAAAEEEDVDSAERIASVVGGETSPRV
jgi:hypothetical protein